MERERERTRERERGERERGGEGREGGGQRQRQRETEKDRDRDNTFTQVTLWLKHDAIRVFRKIPKTDQSAEIIDLQSGFVYRIVYIR